MKIIKYLKNIMLLLVSSVLLNSCEDVISLDIEETSEGLVVEGAITNIDTAIYPLKLSSSLAYFSKQSKIDYTEYKDATVVVFEDGKPYDTLIYDIYREHFLFNKKANPDHFYSLYVKTKEGKEYISKSSEMRKIPTIDTVTYEYKIGEEFAGGFSPLNTVKDTFYLISVVMNKDVSKLYDKNYYQVDVLYDNYFKRSFVDTLAQRKTETITDKYFDLDTIKIRIYIPVPSYYIGYIPKGLRIKIFINSIDRDYYDYYNTIEKESNTFPSIFSSSPSQIIGNITLKDSKKNAHGYFAVKSIEYRDLIIPY